MGDIKQEIASAQSITITLNSLASAASRESTAIDNSTNKYLDALVEVVLVAPNSTLGADKACYVWAYASIDGSTFEDNATGSDAALTMRDPTNLRFLGAVQMPTQNVTYRSAAMSVAQAYGGILPVKWGIVVTNSIGQALAGSGNSARYAGVYASAA